MLCLPVCLPVCLPAGPGSGSCPPRAGPGAHKHSQQLFPNDCRAAALAERDSSALSVLTSSHYAGLPPDHGIYYRCCS